jgi:uncharacterized membrane protein
MKKPRPEANPPPVDLVQRNIETVARMEQVAEARHSPLDRAIDTTTRFIGSLTFVCLQLVGFALWIGLNLRLPQQRHFDPYPFSLLALVVGMEAIILASFILITQNRQQRLADRRAHLELQINMLAEQEATKVLTMLGAIQDHLGIRGHDPEVAALEQATEPEKMMEQIEGQGASLEQNSDPG